jgi:hypothetical protein
MKKPLLSLIIALTSLTTNAQLVATVQMNEKIEGICNHDEVYSLYHGWTGQVEPKCSMSKKEMEVVLNEKLQLLKDNPKFKAKGMVGVYINCEGKAVKWKISNKSKNEEFDKQIIAIFETFDNWEAGTLDGKNVDTHELFSYQVKKGVLTIN